MSDVLTREFDIFEQIEALELNKAPLVICDVDEVTLAFIGPLEAYFESCGYELIEPRFKLTGNIRSRKDGTMTSHEDVRSLIHGFFEAEVENQVPVPHVAKTLEALTVHAQVIMLTNMPERFRAAREKTLKRHQIPYPVLTNIGPKGAAVAKLNERVDGPVFFLDDSEINIASVRDHVETAHLIRFIADERFFALADPVEGAHFMSNCWQDTRRYIEGVLGV